MKNVIAVALIIVLYVGISMITTVGGATDFCHRFHDLAQRKGFYRGEIAAHMFFGFTPLGWIVYPFMTGFYQWGFAWNADECAKSGSPE